MTNSEDPRWGSELFHFMIWLATTYVCILTFVSLEFLSATFLSLMLIFVVGAVEDMIRRP